MAISLSYTTMFAAINEPHTYVCKQMGLKTYSNKYMKDGKAVHRIVQDHVSGVKEHSLLMDLPKFSIVEKVDFDENCKLTKTISDKYYFTGFVDGLNPETGDILEIKSGHRWSPSEFQKLVQWKLYGWASNGKFKKVWLVNVPSDPQVWMPETIRMITTDITKKELDLAEKFIQKAIYTIEHIKDFNLHTEKRSSFCWYVGCPFCPKNG